VLEVAAENAARAFHCHNSGLDRNLDCIRQ
jgi:hypothetical protein